MDKFTLGIRCIEELYKESKYDEAIEECNKYIAEIDHDDFDNFKLLSIFNNHLFNCKFRQSKEEECRWHLSECVRYATTDKETYKAFHNMIRLDVNTTITDKTFQRIEDNLKYYKSVNDILSVADILVLKGKATKDIKFLKEAIEIYKQSDIDTSGEQQRAKNAIRDIIHIS